MKRNVGINKTTSLDIVALSDAFRRGGRFNKPKTVANIVEAGRKLVGQLSNYYPEYENMDQSTLASGLKDTLLTIAKLAQRLEVDEVILPVRGARQDSFSRFLRDKVLKGLNAPVKISFQKAAYSDKNADAIGMIDSSIKTVLDDGYRGFYNHSIRLD